MTAAPSRRLPVSIAAAAACLLVIGVSQLGRIYDGDEGLHLVAVMMVRHGLRPYADFFYWHQPLYLYLAAAWMWLWGGSWRVVHLLSALLTSGAVLVVGGLASTCLPGPGRLVTALAVSFFALNTMVLTWGVVGHNYALCLFFAALAAALAIRAREQAPGWSTFACGMSAGATVATTFLAAPVGPVVCAWVLARTRRDLRLRRALWLGAGAVLPFLPLAWLIVHAPARTLFDVAGHHLKFRVEYDAVSPLKEIARQLIRSPQAMVLMAAAFAGARALRREGVSDRARALGQLCTWLVTALAGFVLIATPAQAMYFVPLTPFLALLAAAGMMAGVSAARRPVLPAVAIIIFAGGLTLSAYRERVWKPAWPRVESFAREVNAVLPPDGSFYTPFTFVYFAANRLPPRGTENPFVTYMEYDPALFDRIGVQPATMLENDVRRGRFDAVLLWDRDPRFEQADLARVYPESRRLDDAFALHWKRGAGTTSP